MTDTPQGFEPDRPEDPGAGGAQPRPPASPPPTPATATRTPESTLRLALLVYAAVNGVTGLLLLLFPRFIWHTVAGAADLFDPAYDSTRFAGGALIALAVGALLVLRDPKGQNTLVTVMVLEAVLVAVAGFWNLFGDEPPTNLWFEVAVPVASTALAAYLAWARVRARKLLKAG